MKKLIIFLLLSMTSFLAVAQTLPTEKVFFTSDRMHYASGDSILVNGWIVRQDNQAGQSYSQYLYLEIANSMDSVLVRQKITVDEHGAFSSILPINFKAPQGIYYLRAYSKMMCNFNGITIPTYPIEINQDGFSARNMDGSINCSIFPEGGHLTEGDMQKVAVYITDKAGKPWQTAFAITDSNGSTVLTSTTTPSGWQMVPLRPEQGKHYYVKVGDSSALFALPETDNTTPTLRLLQGKTRLRFQVDGTMPKDAKLYAYNQSIGLMLLPTQKLGDIDISDLGEGLVTLVITDAKNQILSEGHAWHSGEMKAPTDIRTTYYIGETITPSDITGEKAASTIIRFIPIEETDSAAISDFIPTAEAAINFESDLTSDIPFPRNYALESKADRMTDITCWLQSAKFCRLDIAKAMKDGWKAKYKPEVANVIKGKIYGKDKKWKMKEGTVVAYQKSNAATFTADIQKDATFYMQVGDYPQGDGFFVGATDKKNNPDSYDYEFLGDTLPVVRNYRNFESSLQTVTNNNWKKFDWKGVNDIPEVRITAQVKKDYVQEEKEFYGHKFLTEEAMEKNNYQSFQQMIYHFAPFMKLMQERKDLGEVGDEDTDGGEDEHIVKWHLFPATRISTLKGKVEIKIYVDGVLTDATNAVNLNMDDIATVEFLNGGQALARHPFCLEGCLELTTKRFKPQLIQSKGVMYIPEVGIANYGIRPRTSFMPPTKEGQYLMIIDTLSDDYTSHTSTYKVTVTE